MEISIETCLKRIEALEKKLELYFDLNRVRNELDFILKGTYLLQSEIEAVLAGNE